MKRIIFTLTGITILTVSMLLYSCNKEESDTITTTIENENIDNKEHVMGSSVTEMLPHFLWKEHSNTPAIHCNSVRGGIFCGYNIDDVLSAEEVCWLMRYENDPYNWLYCYFPTDYLSKNKVTEMIDSARNGALTIHADCQILSDELVEFAGVDIIPAGRYLAYMTTFNGDSTVCVDFGTIVE